MLVLWNLQAQLDEGSRISKRIRYGRFLWRLRVLRQKQVRCRLTLQYVSAVRVSKQTGGLRSTLIPLDLLFESEQLRHYTHFSTR